MTTLFIKRKIDLPAERAFALASDFASSPGPGLEVTVHQKGDPAAHGAGTERTLKIGNMAVRERLDSVDPPRSFTYRILSGPPIKTYQGKAEFIDMGSSSEIRWTGQFTPIIPFTGWLLAMVAKKAINRYIDAVASHGR